MSLEISRETRKFEARLKDYIKAGKEFEKHARECITIFEKLGKKIGETSNIEEVRDVSKLRRNAIKSLGRVFSSESNISHERSHILESYGALILSLEKEFNELEA